MPSKNTIVLIGHAGRDAEFKSVGKGLVTFSLPTSKSLFKDGEWTEHTTWWNIKSWGEKAQKLVERIKKGDLVQVTGEAELRPFQRGDGSEGYSLEVNANFWDILPLTKHEKKAPAAEVADQDNLPF